MRIVFHGENAASFSHDFQRLVGETAVISVLPDGLTDRAHAQAYAAAEVIVGARFSGDLPQPRLTRGSDAFQRLYGSIRCSIEPKIEAPAVSVTSIFRWSPNFRNGVVGWPSRRVSTVRCSARHEAP